MRLREPVLAGVRQPETRRQSQEVLINPWCVRRPRSGWRCSPLCGSRKRITAKKAPTAPPRRTQVLARVDGQPWPTVPPRGTVMPYTCRTTLRTYLPYTNSRAPSVHCTGAGTDGVHLPYTVV